jgi:glycosyltransferase involved in cell wall biosynthesis
MSTVEILQLIPRFEIGGAERLALQLHKVYLRRGFNATILSVAGRAPADTIGADTLGVDRPQNIIRLVISLKRYLRERKFNVIHAHLIWVQLALLLAGSLPLRPSLVVTVHRTEFSFHRKLGKIGLFFDRRLLDKFDSIACISGGVRDYVLDCFPDLKDKVYLAQNGIQVPEAKHIPGARRIPVIIAVGRLVRDKRFDVLLQAAALISDLPWKLMICGEGPLRIQLTQHAVELGISDRTEFTGWVDDVQNRMSLSDICVCCSEVEGFGLAALEAMAVGIPVIATAIPGLGEVVAGAGLTVPPNAPNALSEALRRLICNPMERRLLSERGRERAANYSIEKTADAYVRIYREAISPIARWVH